MREGLNVFQTKIRNSLKSFENHVNHLKGLLQLLVGPSRRPLAIFTTFSYMFRNVYSFCNVTKIKILHRIRNRMSKNTLFGLLNIKKISIAISSKKYLSPITEVTNRDEHSLEIEANRK